MKYNAELIQKNFLRIKEKKGVTLQQIITGTGLGSQTITNVAYGKKTYPSITTLINIANYFDIDLNEFFKK